jgi:peptide/nickel transport system permease protein
MQLGVPSQKERMRNMAYASQWKLIVRRFGRHKVALASLYLLALLYILAIFADFFAPYEQNARHADQLYVPPTAIHVYDPKSGITRPFVYGVKTVLNETTYVYEKQEDKSQKFIVRFFCRGEPYRLFGIIPGSVHLFGVDDGLIALFGTDNLGIDIFSQTLYAARISLSVSLVGVLISFVLGTILGGISGFFGGISDILIQRLIEFLMSIPTLPLWIALSAAVPNNWSGIRTFFAITIILSVVGWTGLARVVRGRLISMREDDYVMAAKVAGARDLTIITRHLLPGFLSYLIVNITLAIPGMILGETTLSFLGIGINPPDVSWGTLLQKARDIPVLLHYPWYLLPCAFVIGAVLFFNFVGDGLRDAADPYAR